MKCRFRGKKSIFEQRRSTYRCSAFIFKLWLVEGGESGKQKSPAIERGFAKEVYPKTVFLIANILSFQSFANVLEYGEIVTLPAS